MIPFVENPTTGKTEFIVTERQSVVALGEESGEKGLQKSAKEILGVLTFVKTHKLF